VRDGGWVVGAAPEGSPNSFSLARRSGAFGVKFPHPVGDVFCAQAEVLHQYPGLAGEAEANRNSYPVEQQGGLEVGGWEPSMLNRRCLHNFQHDPLTVPAPAATPRHDGHDGS